MEQDNQSTSAQAAASLDEVKTFYKNRLPHIFKAVFVKPIQGAYELFSTPSEKNYVHALTLMISTGLIFFILPYLGAGSAREFVGFTSFLLLGVAAILGLLLISGCSFIIKSVSGKSDFKNELLTGGICGIPLSCLMIVLFVTGLFSDNMAQSMFNPAGLFFGSTLLLLIFVYCLLSMVNIFQQSLRSAGVNETLGWYLSPLSILLSFYIASKIAFSLAG